MAALNLSTRDKGKVSAGTTDRPELQEQHDFRVEHPQAPGPTRIGMLPAEYSMFTRPSFARPRWFDLRPGWWWMNWSFSGLAPLFRRYPIAAESRRNPTQPTPRIGPLERSIARRIPSTRLRES